MTKREREEKKEKKKTVFSKESNAENWSNIKDNGKTICKDNGSLCILLAQRQNPNSILHTTSY